MAKASPQRQIIEALATRGWCFRDADEIQSMIQTMIPSGRDEMGSLGLVEEGLLDMDLREIGGVSLPEPSDIKRTSHLQGPKILQVVSVRDIAQSSVEASLKNFQHQRRLLRFILTDGRSEVTAVEYAPIPSITNITVPGTKVRLQHRVPVHSGIVCLDSRTLTVLGGVVQNLFEEWEMNQKYSSLARSTLRVSQTNDGGGPPPFERLQVGRSSLLEDFPDPPESNSKPVASIHVKGASSSREVTDKGEDNVETSAVGGKAEDKPSGSESRPKEVSEAAPVQNQVAAQKLLQKMSYPKKDDRPSRVTKNRGKGRQEDPVVFTLDEWEKRKGSTKSVARDSFQDVSQDEELACQLQNQLDMEDSHARRIPGGEAEDIRMNMFSFVRYEDGREDGRRDFRGRGHGRARGKRRFN